MYTHGCRKYITEIRRIVNRRLPPRLHIAPSPAGDYVISTSHTPPVRRSVVRQGVPPNPRGIVERTA